MTSHYNVKCGSFIARKCHCSSAYSPNTLIHLSHLGNILQILFWWTEGWCICSDSWIAITMYSLFWYMARWDPCTHCSGTWQDGTRASLCFGDHVEKQCYVNGKFNFCDRGSLTYWTSLGLVLTNWESGQS